MSKNSMYYTMGQAHDGYGFIDKVCGDCLGLTGSMFDDMLEE